MNEINTQLRNLGLGDHEALVYGMLLVSSPANATMIAKKCALSRSSVYTTLNALIGKGFVGTTYKNNVKQFIAQDLDILERSLKNEQQAVEKKFRLVGSLKATLAQLGNSETQIPQVIFFEGQDGLKKIYLSMMRNAPKGSTRFLLRDEFVWRPEWKFIYEMEWHSTVERMKREKAMLTKLLVNNSALEKSKKSFYRSQKSLAYRFLPQHHSVHQFALYIIGESVAILSMEHNNLVGIHITNKNIADNFKNLFEGLWEKGNA